MVEQPVSHEKVPFRWILAGWLFIVVAIGFGIVGVAVLPLLFTF